MGHKRILVSMKAQNVKINKVPFECGCCDGLTGLEVHINLSTFPVLLYCAIQSGLENLQEWRLHSLSGHSASHCLTACVLVVRIFSLMSSLNSSRFKVASHLPTMHRWVQLGFVVLMASNY